MGLFLSLLSTFAQAEDFSESRAQALFQEYCLRCHGAQISNGDVRLDDLTADFSTPTSAAVWVEVRNQINAGEMPPFDEAQPEIEEIDALSKWIAKGLREAERSALANNGRVLMRRLNRQEYANTLEDLLKLRFPTGESPLDLLPPDGTAEGFNKVSAALLVDPSLLSKYYEVARRVVEKVIVDGEPEFPTQVLRFEFEDTPTTVVANNTMNELGVQVVPGGLQLINSTVRMWSTLGYNGEGTSPTPTNGFYRFTVKAMGAPGKEGTYPRMQLTQSHPDNDGGLIMDVEVKTPNGQGREFTVTVPRDNQGGEIKVGVVEGPSMMMGFRPGEDFRRRNSEIGEDRSQFAEIIRLDGRRHAEGWGGDRSTPDPAKLDLTQFPRLYVDYIEVEGPLYDDWPPPFQKKYLGEDSNTLTDRSEQLMRAQKTFADFLPRAFRRPVTPEEIQPFMKVVRTELEHGESFHEAMRIGVAAVLTSPKFLFLHEPNPAQEPRPLTEFELATRLSYFLWNSMPDEELFGLAAQGKLSQPQVLMAQVDRMLDDPRRERFIDSFGAQWLRTKDFLAFEPNQRLFEGYDDRLGEAAVREPLEFFHFLIDQDMSLLSFLDSDFLVINDRLARHYGIEGVDGAEFRPVKIPEDSVRGGLLGMAGVHLAGSDGQRTKPVTRAVYVREVLFNDPPDPPPPNAGEVEPNIKGENLTVVQRLIQHQEIPSCAACHQRLDPYGIALENFNVIGQWRDQEDGEGFRRDNPNNPEIVAAGRLPNGDEFASYQEFQQKMVEQSGRFRRGMTEKMLTYALGRPIAPSDEPTVEAISQALAQHDDKFSVLVKAVVASEVFRMK